MLTHEQRFLCLLPSFRRMKSVTDHTPGEARVETNSYSTNDKDRTEDDEYPNGSSSSRKHHVPHASCRQALGPSVGTKRTTTDPTESAAASPLRVFRPVPTTTTTLLPNNLQPPRRAARPSLLRFLAMAAPPQPTPAPLAADAAFRLGLVGAGNLAESIARGVAASGVLPASAIRTAPHRRPERGAAFASLGARILDSNAQVVDDSDVIVISVKPQIVKQVLVELKPFLSEEKLLVSIAAGIKMKDLQDWSGQRRIIRVMPNTPSALGQAASVMCLGEMATEKDEDRVKSLFSAIGKVWTAEEKYFDAVTGLSGSGPAYIFLAIEAMADGGVAAGLPRDLALGLASQTVLGAATMVSETGKHPGQLKDQVTSPAGTTIAGVHELEKGSFRGTLINAVVAATTRCRELSKN